MVSALGAVGLVLVLVVHTAVAAVLTRLLRVRLATRWGPVLYAAILIPVVLVLSTLVFSGVFGLGVDLGAPGVALLVTVGAPLAIGLAIDYLWMPAPDEVELPEPAE